MAWWWAVLLILGGYLLGSAQHLRLIAYLCGIHLDGDYHLELYARRWWLGVIGVMGEFIKGILPVLAGKLLGFEPWAIIAAGMAAVCGQMWPVFARFDGEKGNSIAIGMVFTLVPLAAAYAIIAVLVALVFRMAPRIRAKRSGRQTTTVIGGNYSKSLPLGMLACFFLLPWLAWWLGEPAEYVWGLGVLFILMIVVRRITAGLRRDLRTNRDARGVILRRFLYDRATVAWRQ